MNEAMNNWSVQVAGMALISAAATAVFWVTEGFEAAWPFALVMTAFIAVVHFGRQRSNVLEVMSELDPERALRGVRVLLHHRGDLAGAQELVAAGGSRPRSPAAPGRPSQFVLRTQ